MSVKARRRRQLRVSSLNRDPKNVPDEDHIGKEWSAKVGDQGDCAQLIDRTVVVTEQS